MTHDIGPAIRTTTIHKAWDVYKDYDGNAPDTAVFATCATPELAEELADLLNKKDPSGPNYDGIDTFEFPWPFCDGWEWSAKWRVTESEAEHSKIARTLQEALWQCGAETE